MKDMPVTKKVISYIEENLDKELSLGKIAEALSYSKFYLARTFKEDTEIMIHQPAVHGNGIKGQATDIKIMSDHIQRSKERLNRILAENTGKTIEEIQAATERDHYLSAQEALEFGLIDKIIAVR